MGCDIHSKTFVFSKVENKMIPLDSAFEDSSGWERYPCIVGDRDYSLFGMLGNSSRSYYPEMHGLNYGCPPFAQNLTIGKEMMCSDYHTHRWCDARTLKKNLLEYKECLENYEKFREKFGDDNSLIGGFYYDDTPNPNDFKNGWKEEHRYLVNSIDKMLRDISVIEEFVADYSEILDKDQIVFAFWMDN